MPTVLFIVEEICTVHQFNKSCTPPPPLPSLLPPFFTYHLWANLQKHKRESVRFARCQFWILNNSFHERRMGPSDKEPCLRNSDLGFHERRMGPSAKKTMFR